MSTQDILPCPFCGATSVSFSEGSTFRWLLLNCDECGASPGEVRVQTLGDGARDDWRKQGEADAIAAWNRRSALTDQGDGRYSQGVCEDGAAILCDGVPITVEEIIARLNRLPTITDQGADSMGVHAIMRNMRSRGHFTAGDLEDIEREFKRVTEQGVGEGLSDVTLTTAINYLQRIVDCPLGNGAIKDYRALAAARELLASSALDQLNSYRHPAPAVAEGWNVKMMNAAADAFEDYMAVADKNKYWSNLTGALQVAFRAALAATPQPDCTEGEKP